MVIKVGPYWIVTTSQNIFKDGVKSTNGDHLEYTSFNIRGGGGDAPAHLLMAAI